MEGIIFCVGVKKQEISIGTQKRVRITHGKRAIDVRVIDVLLYNMYFDSQFVAIAARDKDRAQKYADRLGFEKAYGSYDDLVNDPDVGKFVSYLLTR